MQKNSIQPSHNLVFGHRTLVHLYIMSTKKNFFVNEYEKFDQYRLVYKHDLFNEKEIRYYFSISLFKILWKYKNGF